MLDHSACPEKSHPINEVVPVAVCAQDLIALMHAGIEERQAKRHHDHTRKAHDGVERVHDLGVDPS